MEESVVARFFASALSAEEWGTLPSELAKKIETVTENKFEELMTSKALLETNRFNAEKELEEIKKKCEVITNENTELKLKLESATCAIQELENQLSQTVAETAKLQESCNRLEKESSDFRHQRNLAVDERDECQKMLDRRNTEVERMQTDINTLNKQLESAISAKCEAVAKSEEVAALKLTLEYKEKRIEQERILLNSQVENLTEDLNNRTEELLNIRRDNTMRCFQLESKLAEKVQELRLATDSIKTITDTNNNLISKIEEYNQKLQNEKETASKTQEAFQHEMEAQKKLAELYQEVSQEKSNLAEKLTEGYQEVKTKLDSAIEKYGELETIHKEATLAHEEILSKKNECIDMLKKELEAATLLLDSAKQNNFEKDVEGLSPSAAIASKFIKGGMSMTQIYTEYTAVSEQLTNSREECSKLQAYISSIIQELEDKSPMLTKQREDYERALDTIADLSRHNDDLINEMQLLRESNVEAKRSEGVATRDNARLKKEMLDLSRQVCHLLREVENSRAGGSLSTSTDQDLSDSTSSADIITKRLVTFSDINELQSNNQRLLALVRELSSKHEEAEELDVAAVAKLKNKLESMREEHADLLENQEKQTKMMNMLINQRDMYKNLYHQAMKGAGEDMPMQLEQPYVKENQSQSPKPHNSTELQNEDKIQELEVQIDKLNKEIQIGKDEYDTYKKEKDTNEKILVEQLDKARADAQDLMRQNTKLATKVETTEEMFKVLKNNTTIYKNQIEKLEERNRIYGETIVKHETSVKYLRDDAMEAQTKLARVEVLLGNLQKENALLRDSESRLMKERESYKREAHSQNLLHTNIELIKATLERNDAESKLRLEEQLREAHRECSALRRRLQEEQDRFRQLSEHLEKQTHNAQDRMQEEKQQADKLRTELTEVREDLISKSTQIEDLSKKLKTSLFSGVDTSADSKKYRELEKMLNENQAEIESLQQKLKAAKESVEQHSNVAECAEKQLVEVVEQQKQYRNTTESKLREQETRIKQLEEECSELQGELSVYNDGQEITNTDIRRLEKVHSQTSKELNDTKRELEAARNEIKVLQDNLETAENKYAREMMLHSNDLQTLTTIKEELAKTVSEIEAVKAVRDKANVALEESKACWSKQEMLYQKEKQELESRFKDLDSQNSLLLNQLQELNTQLGLVQAQATEPQNTSLDVSLNRSFTEDDVKSSEQLLKIIKYLRQEKDIAVSKCEILEAEHTRMKSLQDVVNKQLEEAKSALEAERQKSDVSVVTAAKHSEVLRKVETLNAITDSNRTLRLERDSLLAQINELKARITTLEEQVAPLQEKNCELTIKAEAMQTETVTLRSEVNRWRQRANILIEKSNRTSPEDWKKLQNERETLAKQLTVERANNTQLNIDLNNVTKEKVKLEEALKELRKQQALQKEDIDKLNEELTSLRTQVTNLSNDLQHSKNDHNKLTEDHRILTEDTAAKDIMINDLKGNLIQIRKIAKKYKTQCEDLSKEIESLKQQNEAKENAEVAEDKQEQFRQEGRLESEEKMKQLEVEHNSKLTEVNQKLTTKDEEIENYKKEIEGFKQSSLEKEERFKTLFKNAKDRIVTLTEQNNTLKSELNSQDRQSKSADTQNEKEEIDKLKKEKDEILAEKQAEKEKLTQEIETLTQRVNQLQRQLGLQHGSKPSTSSGPTEKSTSEPPTANIKPMSGHSTNTQTQSVTIQPWRSGGEPPLASIRPMSVPLRTVAVLPTSQSPSAVMVPPHQQVHTTGSSNIEGLSSSPTSSHTDYAPATSSAGSTMLGPRQVAVPPTQSSQENEDEDNNMQVQTAPLQQAVALVLPRVEPPNSGPTQEQGTSSSSSSNTVTTTQAGHKRPREADTDSCQSEENSKQQPQKRVRVQGTTETFQGVSESGLEVEYQVPTSSQRDHEEDTDAVIVVESDDDGEGPDEGEGADDDPDDPDTESYDMEGIPYSEQMNFEDAECQEVEEDEGGNEVEVIDDSSEVPNQSETQETRAQEEGAEQAQSEAISSGTDGNSCVTVSQASTSVSVTMPSSRTRPVAPLTRQQQTHLLLPEDGGDDGIVPSTPTLFVPRRSDGFGEAVSSPHVPTSGRFTFNESVPPSNVGSNEVIPEQTLEIANLDDNSTGRSVPSTPLQASPQEAGPSGEEQTTHPTIHTDVEIPAITVSEAADEPEQAPEGSSTECMGPPSVAGTSTENTQHSEQTEEMLEGEDGVTSEGEKPLTSEEGEEEGREAEATPSTNTRSKSATSRSSSSSSSNRRGLRQSSHMRGSVSRSGPTPIVWADQRGGHNRQANEQWQYYQHGDPWEANYSTPRGRGQGNYSARVARRSRGRVQRPYGGGNRF